MELAARAGHLLMEHGRTLAVAESCTGGLLGHLITNVSGSSAYFLGGVLSYSNEAKQSFLGVRNATLEQHGAVSAETALEMARGVRQAFDADMGISVTGIAGPGGGTDEKPVGLVFVALADWRGVEVRRHLWPHDRVGNKVASAEAALELLCDRLSGGGTMSESEGDPVRVEALFGADGTLRPTAINEGNRRQSITDWGRQWRDERGRTHFLVMVGPQRVIELIFDPTGMTWYALSRSAGQTVV